MVDEAILEKKIKMKKRGKLAEDNINETSEEELNTNIKVIIAKLLSGNIKNMDADKLADIGDPIADDWTNQMMDAMKSAREEAPAQVLPQEVVDQMGVAEASGAGGGGVPGFAGGAWPKNTKRSRRWQNDK